MLLRVGRLDEAVLLEWRGCPPPVLRGGAWVAACDLDGGLGCAPGTGGSSLQSGSSSSLSGGRGMYLGASLVGVMLFARSLRILCSRRMTASKPRYCIIMSMRS
jgi:hypothetical protein